MRNIIKDKLTLKLNPSVLEIKDDSDKHRHHSGWKEGGETHFDVLIVSNVFEGINRVKRHKLIYDILSHELKTQIHALAIKAYTQEEYKRLFG